MTCKEAIKIYRGDDTNWNGETLLHFKVTSTTETVDLSTMTAEFILGNIVKKDISLDEGGEFDVNYSHEETASLPWGPIKGTLKIFDSNSRIKTVANSIPFFVTSEPVGEQREEITVPVPETSSIQIDVVVGGGGGGSWGSITGDIQEQADLQAEFNTKMDKSGGTFTGDVTLAQGVSIKTQVGEVHDVNDNIVIGGKNTNYGLYVAPDGTAAALVGQNSLKDIITNADVKSTYSASGTDPVNGQAVASAISNKQDTISDLDAIRSGAALGATSVQPGALETALSTKQDSLSTTQMEAVNSGANSTNIGQIATNASSISGIEAKIPSQASSENQLADKDFVNSSIATNTANFIGTFESVSALEAYVGTITNNDYAFVVNGVVTDNGNDWATLTDLNAYDKTLLTNFDYAWVVNGSKFDLYRFDIVLQTWDLRAENIHKNDVSLNTAYNRYKATVVSNVVSWEYEYTLNNSSFTAAQWEAINSGATTTNIGQIATNTSAISSLQSNKLDVTTAASTYLSKTDAASTYLTQSNAASTYLTQSNAASTYLTQSSASSTYLTKANAASTYLSQSDAATTYLPSATAATTYATKTELAGKQNLLTAGENIQIAAQYAYSGFSANDSIVIPGGFVPGSSSWEIVCHIRTGSDTSGQKTFFCSADIAYRGASMAITNGYFVSYLGEDNRWISDGSVVIPTSPDTEYYCKTAFDGVDTYTNSISTDGITFTGDQTVTDSTPISGSTVAKFGYLLFNSMNAFNGKLYMPGTYIKVGGEYVFDGNTAVQGVDYMISGTLTVETIGTGATISAPKVATKTELASKLDITTAASTYATQSALTTGLSAKQDKTLSAAITVDGVSQTTVESALGAINTFVDSKKSGVIFRTWED